MQKKYFFLGLLTGVLLSLSFPPYPFFLLAFVAFIPIFSVFLLVRRKWILLYIVFLIYHSATNWWISSWQKDSDPYLLVSGIVLAFVHPLFFMLPFVGLNIVSKRKNYRFALFLFPFFWTAFEWLHSLGDLAYPWLSVGYTQIYNHYWIQIADLGAVWLVSFLIVFANVLIFLAIDDYNRKGFSNLRYLIFNRFAFVFYFILIAPYIYGILRAKQFEPSNIQAHREKIRVGIIQPNINPWRKWETNAFDQILIHKKVQDSLLERYSDIDLVVWSETAITFLSLEVNANHNFSIFYDFLSKDSLSLLTGFADFYFLKPTDKKTFATKYFLDDTTKPYNTYNSILLLNPVGNNYQIYHKIRLTPFGEQIPFGEVFGFARDFLEWNVGISSWTKGKEQNLLNMNNGKRTTNIAPIICIESIYPDYCAEFVRKGAEIGVIITNDGWYDYTFGPIQHYLIATVRAIETRRFIVRCANTGISGVISPNGTTVVKAPQYQRVGIVVDVPKLNEMTIYTRFGDWLPYLSITISLFGIIFALLSKCRAEGQRK
ncbi:MAG: apolipoprotein N-acyltransferase [Ignavibacteria bacterium]|nr:apolipoprotein N-acyltransferase [Ignavibacteria bacterium]